MNAGLELAPPSLHLRRDRQVNPVKTEFKRPCPTGSNRYGDGGKIRSDRQRRGMDTGCSILDRGCVILDPGCWILDPDLSFKVGGFGFGTSESEIRA